MQINRRVLLLSSTLAGLVAFLPRSNAAPATVKYGSGYLDIYPVESSDPSPVVAFVHGGAWQYGNRRRVDAKPEFFNRLGYTFVSIGYRKVPNVTVSDQVGDVVDAVEWLSANIGGYGGDAKRLALMGHSAGAHLASLSALKLGPKRLRCLISNDTRVYDVETVIKTSQGRAKRIYEKVFPDPSRWPELSPIQQVGPGKAPSTLVMWSGGGNRGYFQTAFVELLLESGADVETYDNRDLNHRQINRQIGTGEVPDLDSSIADFLSKCMD